MAYSVLNLLRFTVGFLPAKCGSPRVLLDKNLNLFLNYSCDTWSCHEKLIWLGGQKPLTLNLDPWKFGAQKFWRREETFLKCHLKSCDHVTEDQKDLWMETQFDVYRLCGSGDEKFLFFCGLLRDLMIKGTYDLRSGSPST